MLEVIRSQGLRRGCVLSPLLFNVFFAAVLHIALVRLSEDEGIMANLVHLEKYGVDGETLRIDRV